ncbi:lipocalin family protein [Desulfoscipio gibsoniae]|uniref:Putative secreted hydrolase n=1 Tax=Desulfoscipio gibsoniae DSM 7213 TaxID=767817 RepID=R4KGK8_9FIRM|nr:lipocalin family protein [Desulfoscipio gibsoniae]AGL02343.1 putative secreted hydrolase [Desulfoscipio gibsoniae DSM 7213]
MGKFQQKFNSGKIMLPEDAGPHPSSNVEWWYYFAFLKGDKGGNYATMASFFRIGEPGLFKGHYLIFSLVDLDRYTHRAFSLLDKKAAVYMLFFIPYDLLLDPLDKRMWKLGYNLLKRKLPYPHKELENVDVQKMPTRLVYGNNCLNFVNRSEDCFVVHLAEEEVTIDLNFVPQKPIALVGGDGKPNQLFYYSFPHNQVEGRIRNGQVVENVTGTGWFDHQWGRSHTLTFKTGWDWFGIQLNDGRELLMNRFNSIKNGRSFRPMANLIDYSGNVFFTRDVEYYPVKYWKSPFTKAVYPLEWQIVIPEFYMKMKVSYFSMQEAPIIGPLHAIWEGACFISGEEMMINQKVREILGVGYMELVGYANEIDTGIQVFPRLGVGIRKYSRR